MTEARWSVVVLAALIFGGVTVIFGGILQNYPLAAGAGLLGALVFGAVAFFLASDGDKHIHDPTQGAKKRAMT